MATSLLDTAFEAEFRALVFLFLIDEPVNADYLGALDTLASCVHALTSCVKH